MRLTGEKYDSNRTNRDSKDAIIFVRGKRSEGKKKGMERGTAKYTSERRFSIPSYISASILSLIHGTPHIC